MCIRDSLYEVIKQPLNLTGTLGSYDIFVNVNGGGFTGQAGAARHGISRALPVSYTHLRAHETVLDIVCRLLLEKKKTTQSII